MLRSQDDAEMPPKDGSRTLVVLLHGLRKGPIFLRGLQEAAEQQLQGVECYAPRMPFSALSTASAKEVVSGLVADIDERVAAREADKSRQPYDSIILVGHSFGAVLARAIWVEAHGAQPDGSIAPSAQRCWAHRIKRIVMLAAVSRGYSTDSPASLGGRLQFWAGDMIEGVFGRCLTAFSLRRGSPFLTCLRLQCLAVGASLRASKQAPIVVQLLGTRDDMVAPTDNIDLATSREFFFIEVPKSGHLDIADLAEPGRGQTRRALYLLALAGDPQDLHRNALPTQDVYRIFDESVDSFDISNEAEAEQVRRKLAEVQRVVFIVHGIRDYGYWTRKMAAHIRGQARKGAIACRCVTSSYGFFPMGPFLLPSVRRRRAEWLMDQYVQAKALYPCADFSFIGHSNGTYLLASALTSCPALEFDSVVFAGSVVSTRFPWAELIMGKLPGAGKVRRLANYIATGDWVVATFPKFFQLIPWFDLGSAGHDGFECNNSAVKQIRYVPGEHSAALQEEYWEEMAAYVLGGDEPPDRAERVTNGGSVAVLEEHQPSYLKWAWLAAPIGGVVLLSLLWAPLIPLGFPAPSEVGCWLSGLSLAPYVWAIAFVAIAWLISRVLTKL